MSRGGNSGNVPWIVVVGAAVVTVVLIALDAVVDFFEKRMEAARSTDSLSNQVSSDVDTITEFRELVTPSVVLLLSIVGLVIVVVITLYQSK